MVGATTTAELAATVFLIKDLLVSIVYLV